MRFRKQPHTARSPYGHEWFLVRISEDSTVSVWECRHCHTQRLVPT